MRDRDLPGADQRFAVKAHLLDHLRFPAEAFHVVHVGEHRVKALHPGRPGRDQHVRAAAQHFQAVRVVARLHGFAVVAPGDRNADHPFRAGQADLVGVQDAFGRFQRRHHQRHAGFFAKFSFRLFNVFNDRPHVPGAFALGDADAVGPRRHADPDIFLPVGRIQAVDAHNALHAPVVDRGQRAVEREARRVLLVLGHRVFKVDHQGVRAVDIGILEQAQPLGIEKHHRAARALQPFPDLFGHLMAPPQGKAASGSVPAARNAAHSRRAFSVHSSAPLSTTLTRASAMSRRFIVSSTQALIWRPYCASTLERISIESPSPGSSVTCASLDSSVPAIAGFFTCILLPPL
ncbi:hypothetical protein SDC9_122283 [bioreactor metagenome]|uniref:Uncharacterized protein n=1 Tax=bioreactor metagenome TaxID=1076179 RepID=A0A645CEB5_9ZZZZ